MSRYQYLETGLSPDDHAKKRFMKNPKMWARFPTIERFHLIYGRPGDRSEISGERKIALNSDFHHQNLPTAESRGKIEHSENSCLKPVCKYLDRAN